MEEKKKQKTPLIVPILWFVCASLWCVNFALRLSSPYTEEGTLVLTALAGFAALAAALVHLKRYKAEKSESEEGK